MRGEPKFCGVLAMVFPGEGGWVLAGLLGAGLRRSQLLPLTIYSSP